MRFRRSFRRLYPRARRDAISDHHVEIELLSSTLNVNISDEFRGAFSEIYFQ